MALLILFGLIAGAGTAVSPCVLPVLPIALAAGATGGRRRPTGIVVGLAGSFTFATVALVYVIDALGLPNDLLRTLAIVALLAFGAVLLVPPLAARVEGRLSRLVAGVAPARGHGDGFVSGLLVGVSLGLVYAPCAGPVLAGVITVSASQSFTVGRLAVAFAYGIGSALVLYALMLGGRRLTAPLARRSGVLQIGTGAVMVLVAVAMLGDYDLRFQSAIAKDLPSFLVNPTGHLERTGAAKTALADLRGKPHGVGGAAQTASAKAKATTTTSDASVKRLTLPSLGTAPEFTGTERWFNTRNDRPLSLASLRGHVVLVDFWTYSCINCLRTLPYLEAWDRRYRADGLTIVGVHTPEFPFEKQAGNVAAAIAREGIPYPVAQDNEMGTWSAYGNQYWPAEYFIDAQGQVRYAHFGEGDYAHKEQVIRTLLAEAGRTVRSGESGARGITASNGVTTPESYLGAQRADRFVNGPIGVGSTDFGSTPAPPRDHLAYNGRWQVADESATATHGAGLQLHFGARRVYLVLGSPGRARHVTVMLDDHPIAAAVAGDDVHGGRVTVRKQRLYELVDLPRVGNHVLRLQFDAGVAGYAFTFG